MSSVEHLWDFKRSPGGHYSAPVPVLPGQGMKALRTFFPEAKANEMNFVLFSTSGGHGVYHTIEEEEACPLEVPKNSYEVAKGTVGITFVIVQPRIVAMRYGNCYPETPEDLDFLKRLRQSSWDVMAQIGKGA